MSPPIQNNHPARSLEREREIRDVMSYSQIADASGDVGKDSHSSLSENPCPDNKQGHHSWEGSKGGQGSGFGVDSSSVAPLLGDGHGCALVGMCNGPGFPTGRLAFLSSLSPLKTVCPRQM